MPACATMSSARGLTEFALLTRNKNNVLNDEEARGRVSTPQISQLGQREEDHRITISLDNNIGVNGGGEGCL